MKIIPQGRPKPIRPQDVKPMKEILNIEHFNHFAFPLTNSCNLSCDCCSVHADHPIDKQSRYPERRTLYRMKKKEIKKILNMLDGMGRGDWHRLTGGEPTLFLDDCIDAINLLHDDGRQNICLATNGLHLLDIPVDTLNKIRWIELDNHGVNDELVQRIQKHLKQHYQHYTRVIEYKTHYDLHYARCHPKNTGYCGHIMRVIKFRDGIIYPCGHFECLTCFRTNTDIQDILVRNHWTYDYDDIPFLLKNWREYLPLEWPGVCFLCWRPNEDIRTFKTMG